METEKLSEEIKKQAKNIKELEKKIKKLEAELYTLNEITPTDKTALRVKDIAHKYSIAKSTVWLYAKEEYITPIKNSSRVTTFDAEEVELFFKERNNQAMDITPKTSASKPTYQLAKEKAQKQNPQMIARKKKIVKISPTTPLNKSSIK